MADTRIKRQSQKCKVYQLKIDSSRCSKSQLNSLQMYFNEAKWLYNYFLNKGEIFGQSYKISDVQGFDKDKKLIEHQLEFLPAKNKQIILQELKQNIYNLSKSKKKGNKIGPLKFKSQYNSLDFNQYGNSHKIVSTKRFKLQGIKKPLFIRGLNQLTGYEEFANCKLIRKPSGYYIYLTTFEYIKPSLTQKPKLGLDFGIKNNITTSEGKVYNISIEETERLKKLQAWLAIQIKGSNNRWRTRLKIQKEYEKIFNRKKDATNKIVSESLSNYNVFMQDENLKEWKESWFGEQVHHSTMGMIKQKLSQSKSVKIIDKYFPSTKMCYNCGKINEIPLSQRIYKCCCGLEEDRDIKAAKTIMYVGLAAINYTPMGYREEPALKQEDAQSLAEH